MKRAPPIAFVLGGFPAALLFAAEECSPVNHCLAPLDPSLEVTRGPYLQALLAASVEVVWHTRDEVECLVRWEEEGGAAPREAASPAGKAHRVKLDGLAAGKRHRYEVLGPERRPLEGGGPFAFRTAPGAEGSFRAIAFGDSGSLKPAQFEIAAALCRMDPGPEVLIHTGDIIYAGDEDCTLFRTYRRSLATSCFYPARGNHDLHLDWPQLFFPPVDEPDETLTSYSFDWGSAHFATVDTGDYPGFDAASPRFAWLKDDLPRARGRGARWLIVFDHIPLYTVGAYEEEALDVRAILGPIADEFEVDLVLSGHDHNYQRTHPVRGEVVRDAWQGSNYVSPRGTVYVVTGGGGQVRYPDGGLRDLPYLETFQFAFHVLDLEVTPERIAARARGCPLTAGGTCLGDDEVLDEFTIEKGGEGGRCASAAATWTSTARSTSPTPSPS